MEWIGCVRCKKNLTQLRGTNFYTSLARFAPTFIRLQNGPKFTQTVRNIPKYEFRIQWGGLGVHSLRKIPTRLRGTNFCTSSACFAPSFVRHTNGPECTQIVRNAPKLSLGSNGVDRVCSLQKISTQVVGTNFCTSSACFAPSFVRQPNSPECTQIEQNAPKREFRVQRGGSGAFVAKNSAATSWHELLH